MKLFQKLINLVKKLQSMQTKSILNGKTINITANGVLGISSENFSVDTNGNVVANSGKMGGWTLSSTGLINEDGNLYIRNNGYSSIYTYADMVILRNYLLGKIDLDSTDIKHYDVNHDGDVNAGDLLLLRRKILGID